MNIGNFKAIFPQYDDFSHNRHVHYLNPFLKEASFYVVDMLDKSITCYQIIGPIPLLNLINITNMFLNAFFALSLTLSTQCSFIIEF